MTGGLAVAIQVAFLTGLTRPGSSPQPGDPVPTGFSLLAILVGLVALLSVFMAGSEALIGFFNEGGESWQAQSLSMLVLSCLYFVLAWGLLKHARWCLPYAAVLLVVSVIALMADVSRNHVLDLAAMIVFTLAGGTNLLTIGWLWIAHRSERNG